MINFEHCHLSDEADCLNEWGLQVVRRQPVIRSMTVMNRPSNTSLGEAQLIAATLRGNRTVLADRATGQLFDMKSMNCLSGPLFLTEDAHGTI